MSEGGVFVHPNALLESQQVGEGTRVQAFAHVLPGARIGAECDICEHTFVENDVVIGDRVTVKPGVRLLDGVRIEDDVLVTETGCEILTGDLPTGAEDVESLVGHVP